VLFSLQLAMQIPNEQPAATGKDPGWLCYFCQRVCLSPSARASHMRSRHEKENRLVPPPGFLELQERSAPRLSDLSGPLPPASGRLLAAPVLDVHRVHSGGRGEGVTRTPVAFLPGRGASSTERTAAAGGSSNGRFAVGARALHEFNDDILAPHSAAVGRIRVPSDGFARGSLGLPRARNVFQAAIASRIRAYYEGMPEASQTRRLAAPHLGEVPARFNTPSLQKVLEFALTSGGPGLSDAYQKGFWSVLTAVDANARPSPGTRARACSDNLSPPPSSTSSPVATGSSPRQGDTPLIEVFPTGYAFVAAIRGEQQRVLSKLRWDVTPIEVEGVTYMFYSRDILEVVLELLCNANNVQLWGEALCNGADGTRQRSDPMDSDLFLEEQAHVRRRLGEHCFILGIHIFIDEAVVSWSGAYYIYPIRVRVLNIGCGGSRWVTVGYIPHVPKPIGRTAAARRVASDSRNGLLQRCLAVALRRFAAASTVGVPVQLPGRKSLQAFPRVLGLVSDQLGERAVMCLMGNACRFFCSHCMVQREVAGSRAGIGADDRDVASVIDAQMDGAVVRDRDPRPSFRNVLRRQYSALAFVPAIASVWGLVTDRRSLYDIICFDVLHVWKLGVVRMVAQRFPAFLVKACSGGLARLGPVTESLQALNLRAWELGHLCVPAPTSPGYVSLCICVADCRCVRRESGARLS